jgi:transglutaminase-like putative cysteine protease
LPALSSTDAPTYLVSSEYIDWQHPDVARKARELAVPCASSQAVAQACFEFVRDSIHHSWDARLNPVTCRASDVLRYRTGYCYAKSHLFAALARANGIPAGLCYQRLALDDNARFCLHGFNAVFLEPHGWYRIDARGNKPGVHASFNPPVEELAYPVRSRGEALLPGIWSEPLPLVVDVLTRCATIEEVFDHLPDV